MARTPEQKRDAAKNSRLMLFFRTSLEEYRAIETYQEEENKEYDLLLGGTRRGLDHNHETGLVRGVLDWRINRALGIVENSFKELTPHVLRQLATYVEVPPATLVFGKERYGLIGKAQRKKKMIYGPPKEKQC